MDRASRPRRRRTFALRHLATVLLVGAAALYGLARAYESAHPLMPYLRAFAEAAMVGALADWFAVAALFRRPLGLPIPHTGVIPANKDRIGRALGRFVEHNFLAPAAIEARLAPLDFAALLADWFEAPHNRGRIAEHLALAAPRLLEAAPDEEIGRLAHARLRDYLAGRLELAPLMAEMLEALAAENRHQHLIDELLKQAVAVLRDNEPLVRERVSAQTSWLWRRFSVDERVTRRIMAVAEETLAELGADPDRPWRQGIDRAVREFVETLKTSPEYLQKGEAVKAKILDSPALATHLAGLWSEIRRDVADDVRRPDSALRAKLAEGLGRAARSLAEDPALQARFNGWLRKAIVDAVERRRGDVSALIAETVRGWDPATMADKIEQAVGDDLQYIRINGTLIGGLAGVAIHAVSQLFF